MICPLKANITIGIARADSMQSMVCGETVWFPSVRLSVPSWAHNSKPATADLLLCALRAGDRSIAAAAAGDAGSATLSAYVDS